jgi:GPH family glycoside/pentoside/hexuronide:cation symporter
VQSSETLNGIILMMSLIPAGGSLLAAILMNFYKLDPIKMNEIEQELIIRKSI